MNYALALPAPALATFMKAVEKHETTPDIAKSTSSSTADSDCSDVFAKVRCLLKKNASSAVYNHSTVVSQLVKFDSDNVYLSTVKDLDTLKLAVHYFLNKVGKSREQVLQAHCQVALALINIKSHFESKDSKEGGFCLYIEMHFGINRR